jgi:hypothetical protein
MNASLASLSNTALLDQLLRLVQREREATVTLIAHLAEVEKRKLYLAEGYGSMFQYCTRVLHLSEHATYLRLEAARVSLRFPATLAALENGDLNLTAIRLLSPYLTAENLRELLAAARHRTRADIEAFIARRFPRPDVPAVIRKLPVRPAVPVQPAGLEAPVVPAGLESNAVLRTQDAPAKGSSTPPPVVEALAPERYK